MKYKVTYLTGGLPETLKPFRRTVEAKTALQAAMKPLERLTSPAFLRLFARAQGSARAEGVRITAHVHDCRYTWPNGMPFKIESITLEL